MSGSAHPDGLDLPVAPESPAALHEGIAHAGRTGAWRMGADLVRAFSPLAPDAAAAEIATHIKKFWPPRMRHELMAHIRRGDTTIPPLLVSAAEHLLDEDYDHTAATRSSGG